MKFIWRNKWVTEPGYLHPRSPVKMEESKNQTNVLVKPGLFFIQSVRPRHGPDLAAGGSGAGNMAASQ